VQVDRPVMPAEAAVREIPVAVGQERRRPAAGTRRWQLLLVAGWLLQAGLRFWLGHSQTVPLANPDESAYLVAAQILAGGPHANFGHSTLYPAGYPLLISPVFWFLHNPATEYHAVIVINSLVSALIMPLAYVACRRLGLNKPLAYAAAMTTALLPAGVFYSDYAMTDAIFPVLMLAWLLVTHSWMTARSVRGQYLAAVGSALLAGYMYAVHSRGLVVVGCLVLLGALFLLTRLVPRGTVFAAAAAGAVVLAISYGLNQLLVRDLYPEGPRSMSKEVDARLQNAHQLVLVAEKTFGQLWRLTLDSWGVAAIGVVAVVVVLVRRDTDIQTRIMAGLAVAITAGIAISTPFALPADQPQAWASGRYLDCMIIAFFLPGLVVLLRGSKRLVLIYALAAAGPTMLTGVVVEAYVGTAVPTAGFGAAFNFAEPAVLTQNWVQANIFLATAVALALLAAWVAIAVLLPRYRVAVLAGLAVVSLVAVVQMTSNITRASNPMEKASAFGLLGALKPGETIAVSDALGYQIWMPEDYEIWWTSPVFFNPATSSPPAGTDVVEVPWIAGVAEHDTWPTAPAGWHVIAADQETGWVAWHAP
jgi:hypothetical protein